MIMLLGCLIFYILHIIFKSNELNVMSVVMSVIALACVVRDGTIPGEDLILYVAPLFYVILMSTLSLWPSGDRS